MPVKGETLLTFPLLNAYCFGYQTNLILAFKFFLVSAKSYCSPEKCVCAGIKTVGKNVLVAGRSKNVGMPIAMLLHTDRNHERPGGKCVCVCV